MKVTVIMEESNTKNELGLLCDLLWSDPDKDIKGWAENERGVSYVFGQEIISTFLKKHELDLICRAHQVYSLRVSRN